MWPRPQVGYLTSSRLQPASEGMAMGHSWGQVMGSVSWWGWAWGRAWGISRAEDPSLQGRPKVGPPALQASPAWVGAGRCVQGLQRELEEASRLPS